MSPSTLTKPKLPTTAIIIRYRGQIKKVHHYVHFTIINQDLLRSMSMTTEDKKYKSTPEERTANKQRIALAKARAKRWI